MQILGGVSITSITGDVVGSVVGSIATTIADAAVTYAKMQDVSAESKLLGRGEGAGAGDVQEITLGSGLSMSGTTLTASATAFTTQKQSIWVPATAMVARTTNGAAEGTVEMTTNKNMVSTLDFDATTQEFAQFDIRMPKSWNEGTVTFVPVWSHPSTATNFGVVWGLDGVALSDNNALDAAFGTAQTSADTGGTTNNVYQGPESSAITIGGTPAENDYVQFRIHRDPANGSDTMAVDARLHGVMLFYTIDAPSDD